MVAIDQTDRTSAKNRVKAVLQRGEVDGLLALAAATVAEPALAAVEEAGKAGEVTVAKIDLSPGVLQAVADGDLLFGERPAAVPRGLPARGHSAPHNTTRMDFAHPRSSRPALRM